PASRQGSHARTSASWETWRGINRDEVLLASAAASFSTSWKSSENYNPLGWSWKTSRRCSIQTIAATLKRSSAKLPNAGIWDSGGCLMLNISESPKNAGAFSWSRVLDDTPQWTSWLTPLQWTRYLHRLARHGSQNRRMLGLAILLRVRQREATRDTEKPAAGSIWAVSYSLLRKTDGIRWLSGAERLAYMGFARDWMRPTLKRLKLPEMLSRPLWQNGSLKF